MPPLTRSRKKVAFNTLVKILVLTESKYDSDFSVRMTVTKIVKSLLKLVRTLAKLTMPLSVMRFFFGRGG